ncbi:hypothetical protein D9M71_332830 [compost metagenome]|jgi:hypothetical protein
MAASLLKNELANGVDADFQWLWITAIKLYGVVFGGDEQQLAVNFDARAHRVAMTRLDLGGIVTQMEWQRHLSCDLALLFVKDQGWRVGHRYILQADTQRGSGWQRNALQVKNFTIE